ncbi:MAG TPA: TOMM precursor leader peptide-binding protein [Gaiellaceae bacterium]
MNDQPRLRSDVAAAIVDAASVFLLEDRRHVVFEGRAVAAVAPLLDGSRSRSDLLVELSQLPFVEVGRAIAAFESGGFLAAGPPAGDPGADAWWDSAGVDPSAAESALAGATVAVTVLSTASGIEGSLVGLDVGAEGPELVVVDDYLDAALADVNRRHIESGTPWMLVKPTGTEVWIGPVFRPGAGACWECLAQRIRGNRQVERYLESKDGSVRWIPAHAPLAGAALQLTGALAALELQRLIATGRTALDDTIVSFELGTLATERHAVVRQPQCPVCGDPVAAMPALEVQLQPRPKVFTSDGGHRTCTPEETVARLTKHVSRITGAVSSLTKQTREDNGIVVSYAAGHNFALMQDSTYFLRKNLRGRSGGKGRTDAQARAGAICEAVERFDGVFRGDERRIRATYAELGDEALHPEQLLCFSDAQYENRDAWNAVQETNFHTVPRRLDPDLAIDWSPVWSLGRERSLYVPTAYCYFGHPEIRDHFFTACDANGHAAGNTIEEAILQGTMELVERDAASIWWHNRVRRPAFDLDSLDEPYVAALRKHYSTLGRDLWALDLTTDLGIPVVVALSRRIDNPVEDVVFGFGAHVDPRMAALRALSETNQFLPAVSDRRPDGRTIYWMNDRDSVEWWTTATVESEQYLLPDPDAPARRIEDFEPIATDDISEDVRRTVARLDTAGLELLVLDQTRPDIELSVVKTMAPGLRHFWRRLGPGRLFDLPVRLGWLDRPTPEEEMNPRSMFF